VSDATSTKTLLDRLASSYRPEDIFGTFGNALLADRLAALKHRFNEFVSMIHPDKNPSLKDPGFYMNRLLAFRKEADTLLKSGDYGKPRKPPVDAILRSRTGVYTLIEKYCGGEVSNLYLAETETKTKCLLKIVRAPSDNDLLDNEARFLANIHGKDDAKAPIFQKYFPKLLDSFPMIEGGKHRRVNVLDVAEGYFSLAEVRTAYPDGLDVRDAAWMIRRAFEGLGWIHSHNLVHGAVLPEHVLVDPVGHGARIVGWSYAVQSGQRLTAISASRKDMYPASVLKKAPATSVLDVQLIGECAALLVSDRKGKVRSDVPANVDAFFTVCRSGGIKNGWDAYRVYDEVLEKNFGKRKYRAFTMPPRV